MALDTTVRPFVPMHPYMNFTLRGLRIFEVAAACESFSRAAELLDLSQPAVSMQIRQFEGEVGVRLFEKNARGVSLTEAGRNLLLHAREILGRVRATEEAVAAMRGEPKEQLHIGAVCIAHYFVPVLMQAFRALHRDVRLKLSVGSRDEMLSALRDEQVDLVIGGFPPAQADVEAEAFGRHPLCMVAPPDHRLAHAGPLEWDMLRGETFVFREPGSTTRKFLEHLLQSRGLQVAPSIELQGNESVKQAVMAGMGLSFMSAHTFQLELAAGRIAVLDLEDMPKMLDWCLLRRSNTVPSGISARFRRFVLEEGARFAACRLAAAMGETRL